MNPPMIDIPTDVQIISYPSIKPSKQSSPMVFRKICLNDTTYEPLPLVPKDQEVTIAEEYLDLTWSQSDLRDIY